MTRYSSDKWLVKEFPFVMKDRGKVQVAVGYCSSKRCWTADILIEYGSSITVADEVPKISDVEHELGQFGLFTANGREEFEKFKLAAFAHALAC
jgi:hypothetical protein